MASLRRSPRALRRALLALAALAIVALTATACLPAADPATTTTTTTSTTTTTTTVAPQPVQATIVDCPLIGFTYGTQFGPLPGGGFHYGVDMADPEGTPVYAVRNGTLWYWSTGDVGGYSVYLKADDGNTYYYTHLTAYASSLENTTKSVKAGQQIETVNHTGNANGYDHLHFEVRIGGTNGTRVDPRPTLDAANCK
jgi:murein DD-endopeptidase MepM/ murein hydrolase activator NlpD